MRILLSTAFLLLVACLPNSFAKNKPVDKQFSEKQAGVLYSTYLKGALCASRNNARDSLTFLRRVEKLDPDSARVRLRIAGFLMRASDIKGAKYELERAAKLDPDDIDISSALVNLYTRTHDSRSLERQYAIFLENAHKLKPENIKISESLGQFYIYVNRLADAAGLYESIIKTDPDYADGPFWLGYIFSQQGDRKRAVEAWNRCLLLDPGHAPALNSLGYVYAEDGVRLDEAEVMIKKAVDKEPSNGAYLDSLGWLYFKKKDFILADQYLNKALNLLRDPVVYEHLGDVWVEAKDIKKAVNYYKEGIKYFPEDKNLQEKIKQYGADSQTIKE